MADADFESQVNQIIEILACVGGTVLLIWWMIICRKLCSCDPQEADGPNTNGRNTDGRNNNGPNNNGRNNNGRNNNGPNTNGRNSNGPNSNGPNSNGPNSNGPNSNGPNSNGPNNNDRNNNTIQSMEILASMYWCAFEETKNEAILEASRIRPSTSGTEDNGDEESQCIQCDNDDNAVIVHALESARSTRKTKKKKDGSYDDDDDDGSVIGSKNRPSMTNLSSSLIHPRLPADHNRNHLYGNTVRGNCLICLEGLQPREPVVWSINEDCPHIFHKDCMVTFLATKHWAMLERTAELGRQPKEQDNPCPVCRIPFVSVPALEAKPKIASATTARTATTTPRTPTATRFIPARGRDSVDTRDPWNFTAVT